MLLIWKGDFLDVLYYEHWILKLTGLNSKTDKLMYATLPYNSDMLVLTHQWFHTYSLWIESGNFPRVNFCILLKFVLFKNKSCHISHELINNSIAPNNWQIFFLTYAVNSALLLFTYQCCITVPLPHPLCQEKKAKKEASFCPWAQEALALNNLLKASPVPLNALNYHIFPRNSSFNNLWANETVLPATSTKKEQGINC